MTRSESRIVSLGRLAAAGLVVACPALSFGRDATMNPHIPLYQFTHDLDAISLTRISEVQIKPSPRDGQERVSVDLQVEERLWDGRDQTRYSYIFDRPANESARLKFPDPEWGRVELAPGAEVLLVAPSAEAVGGTKSPVYAEQVPSPADPILRSIREVLSAERRRQADAGRFDRLLQWLASEDAVRKLYAAETLAKEKFPVSYAARVTPLYANTFEAEHDPYIKISLGTWLWNDLYPRAGQDGHVAIVNATIAAASTSTTSVQSFALDRLSEADPEVLRLPTVRPTEELISQLESRRNSEPDAGARETLGRVISALRR